MVKKKVLLTGGSGLLGCTSFLTQMESWDIILWVRNHKVNIPSVHTEVVKLEDENEVLGQLSKNRPEIVIHTAGMTNIEECEANEYRAHMANVLTTKNLAKATAKLGIKFVFISTDQVLQDKEGSKEEDVGFPKNIYSKTKLEAEFESLKHNPESIIARTNFYTWGHRGRRSFLDFVVDNLRTKKEITLFDDVRFNPLSARYVLSYIDMLVEKKSKGLFNITGDERLSKYQFGLLVAEVFGLDKGLIKKGLLADSKNMTSRPFNLTIDNNKLKRTLGISHTPSQKDFLTELKNNEVNFTEKLNTAVVKSSNFSHINYGKQTIDDSDFEAILVALDSPWLTQGPKLKLLKRK